MRGMKRRLGYGYLAGGGASLAVVSALLMPVSAQNTQTPPTTPDWSRIAGNFGEVRVLPNGGPAPRTADGRPDLTGRYYPNKAGRMLQGGYRLGDAIMDQYDPAVTPQENPVFKPETKDKYQYPTPYGICPRVVLRPRSPRKPPNTAMELVQRPGVLWILNEFPSHSLDTHRWASAFKSRMCRSMASRSLIGREIRWSSIRRYTIKDEEYLGGEKR